jgi:hypothetical protein
VPGIGGCPEAGIYELDDGECLGGKHMSAARVMRRVFQKEMSVAGCLLSVPMALMWWYFFEANIQSGDTLWLTLMTILFVLTLPGSLALFLVGAWGVFGGPGPWLLGLSIVGSVVNAHLMGMLYFGWLISKTLRRDPGVNRKLPRDDRGSLDWSWEVAGQGLDRAAFFRALAGLLPERLSLLLEGGAHPALLREFLEAHAMPPEADVEVGPMHPRAPAFHIPATSSVLRDLAQLAGQCASEELCDHLHLFTRAGIVLQWYDAFRAPLYVAKSVPRERLETFCAELHTSYRDANPSER